MRLIISLAILASFSLPAWAAKGHAHGEGRVEVVIDKEMLTVSLELPLDAAVGFERPPKTDKERAALSATKKTLEDKPPFLPAATANCSLQSQTTRIPFTGEADRHDHAHEGESHHADIEAEYRYRCTKPAALNSVETSLFKNFSRLYRLEVQRAGPSGQGALRLTPKNPVIRW